MKSIRSEPRIDIHAFGGAARSNSGIEPRCVRCDRSVRRCSGLEVLGSGFNFSVEMCFRCARELVADLLKSIVDAKRLKITRRT